MNWFCDWLTLFVRCEAGREINDGSVVFLKADGAVEYSVDRRLMLAGSFDERVAVRAETGGIISISGNPLKFFQGHNLWGSSDVHGLAAAMTIDVVARLEGVELSGAELQELYELGPRLTRVDCTCMFKLPSGKVQGFLEVLGGAIGGGRQRVQDIGSFDGKTVYIGKTSRRVSQKFYDKGVEFRKHPPALACRLADIPMEQLTGYAGDALRYELVLRGMELKRLELEHASQWTPETGAGLMGERLGKISMLDNLALADEERLELPRKLHAVYALWLDGFELRTHYRKSQFYTLRRELLAYGIDIAKTRPRLVRTEGEPYPLGASLRSFLAATMETPAWAEGSSLSYRPAAVQKVS